MRQTPHLDTTDRFALPEDAGVDFPYSQAVHEGQTDLSLFEGLNPVYRGHFNRRPPARTTAGVAALLKHGRFDMTPVTNA